MMLVGSINNRAAETYMKEFNGRVKVNSRCPLLFPTWFFYVSLTNFALFTSLAVVVVFDSASALLELFLFYVSFACRCV